MVDSDNYNDNISVISERFNKFHKQSHAKHKLDQNFPEKKFFINILFPLFFVGVSQISQKKKKLDSITIYNNYIMKIIML